MYYAVTKAEAERQVARFNEYAATLSPELHEQCWGGAWAHVADYTECWCGTRYTRFTDTTEDDAPLGSTIGPILDHKES